MLRKRTAVPVICLLISASSFLVVFGGISQDAGKTEPQARQAVTGYVNVGDGELYYEQAGAG